MSQKEIKVLVLSLLITTSIASGVVWLVTNYFLDELLTIIQLTHPQDSQITALISFGERILTPGEVAPAKKDGVKAMGGKKFAQAIAHLNVARNLNRNDPETLMYLNNARIGAKTSYTIVASVPIGTNPNAALEILRGIAQAQNEINTIGGIKGVQLRVGIADDQDHPLLTQKIATQLVANPSVLGVVGPYSSDVTLAAGQVYTAGELVAITPTSTSWKITNFSPYIFRTVPSDVISARTLVSYMMTTLQKKNAVVFFNSQSNYSQSLKSEFVSSVVQEGGQISGEFDLSQPGFSPGKTLSQAIKQGSQVLMLAPSPDTLDRTLQLVQVNQQRLSLLAGDNVYNLKTLEVGRQQALGMVVAVPWHIHSRSQSSFSQNSRQLWGADVSWRTATSYDATVALITALKTNPTRLGIQQALSSPSFTADGAVGQIKFLKSGDRQAPVQLVKIIRGNRSGTGYDFEPI
ncbi:amino acid ABC transporter substrate-binding protein [Richelia sinica FACHB-800]|nr:ABC transporter substrate-binding protein [Richelia sinica]MBD2666666.1 amino acid ABC transporter substrate-binding protein [Richelia sinica FACHB-800]